MSALLKGDGSSGGTSGTADGIKRSRARSKPVPRRWRAIFFFLVTHSPTLWCRSLKIKPPAHFLVQNIPAATLCCNFVCAISCDGLLYRFWRINRSIIAGHLSNDCRCPELSNGRRDGIGGWHLGHDSPSLKLICPFLLLLVRRGRNNPWCVQQK